MRKIAIRSGLPFCFLGMALAIGCGDSSSGGGSLDGGTTAGSGGGTGSSTSSTTTGGGSGGGGSPCQQACMKLDALMCPNDMAGQCAQGCGMIGRCQTQEDTLSNCVIATPVMCDGDGNAAPNGCLQEALAYAQCVFGDGGVP
jgi:hypothetical protein